MTIFTDRVVEICNAERQHFQNEKAKEWWDPQYRRIGDYWRALSISRDGRTGIKFLKNADGSLKLDSNGQPMPEKPNKNGNPPWSAAFISFVAREAGAGNNFVYSGYHSKYILNALSQAATPGSNAPWIARRLTQYKPKVGDLIAYGRDYAEAAEFDDASKYINAAIAPDYFPSHTDFVVGVESNRVTTIGGNLSQTVKRQRWPLTSGGFLDLHASNSPTRIAICIMECRI